MEYHCCLWILSLWITLNPSDQDLIVQVITSADIDLDKFDAMAGPTAEQQAKNVASDPFTSAKSFHFIIVRGGILTYVTPVTPWVTLVTLSLLT